MLASQRLTRGFLDMASNAGEVRDVSHLATKFAGLSEAVRTPSLHRGGASSAAGAA